MSSCVGDTISDMTLATLTLAASLTAVVRGQSFGPVDLEAVDPLSLSWNQIHWLVRDQIKEVEELKAEHDEIYNEIAGESEQFGFNDDVKLDDNVVVSDVVSRVTLAHCFRMLWSGEMSG